MHTDDIVRDDYGWRYSCSCGYVSKISGFARLELVMRVHRHRHKVGLAGVYHERRT